MPNQVTLKQIIDCVLSENYSEDCTQTVYDNREKALEANRRSLYRKIDKLFERLGFSKDVLKDGERNIIYYEEDIPMMKILISQLHSGKGIISDFVNNRNGHRRFSSNEVLEFLCADDQSTYLGKVEHILKKEYALRTAESAQEIIRIADREKYRKEYYYERDPAIRHYYAIRDQKILEAIQEDDDLRQYIEKKFGMKAEILFNYATLE